jgi:hypothetical protein
MNMDCNEVQSRLIDFLDNRLPAATREEIENHLLTCEKCREDVQESRVILDTIEEAPVEMPGEGLRENFNDMLQSELNRLAASNNLKQMPAKKIVPMQWSNPLMKIAAGFVILIAGILIGMNLKNNRPDNSSGQISHLDSTVKEMKEVMMFTLLKEESASQRIKAVNYAEEIVHPDQKVIGALLNLLDHDKSVNVRLASLYSLARFSDNPVVRDSLVAALSKQTEPIIQVVLINTLTEKKESRAIKPIQEIISNEKTLKEVREIAQKSLKIL